MKKEISLILIFSAESADAIGVSDCYTLCNLRTEYVVCNYLIYEDKDRIEDGHFERVFVDDFPDVDDEVLLLGGGDDVQGLQHEPGTHDTTILDPHVFGDGVPRTQIRLENHRHGQLNAISLCYLPVKIVDLLTHSQWFSPPTTAMKN